MGKKVSKDNLKFIFLKKHTNKQQEKQKRKQKKTCETCKLLLIIILISSVVWNPSPLNVNNVVNRSQSIFLNFY